MTTILIVNEEVGMKHDPYVTVTLRGVVEGGDDTLLGSTTSPSEDVSRRITRMGMLAYLSERWGVDDLLLSELTRRASKKEET